MSERMIELQRARMLQSSRGGVSNQSPAAVAGKKGPQHEAVQSIKSEDIQMESFLKKIQRRDDSSIAADSTSGPTVPTALSRRLLHKQGVGFIDDTVCSLASASADRFLATVLHQAVACRDQRLKGSRMVQEARLQRKRHIEQYHADADGRRQRKVEYERQREKSNLRAIAAADATKKGGSAASKKDADGNTKTTKKKKKSQGVAFDAQANKANNDAPGPVGSDDEESYDSIDEEEEFYQDYYADENDESSDEEEDETLKLTDISRPLQAWDFFLAGKLAVEWSEDSVEKGSDDEGGDDKSRADAAEEGEANQDTSMDDGEGFASPGRPSQSAQNADTPN